MFSFFGATPGLVDRQAVAARPRVAEQSRRTRRLADNFCNRWSGGLNFLRHRHNGSEVSIEPDGAVYPCCIKTKLPIGSLLEDNLIDILESLAGVPAFEAITMGHPERMGLTHGWTEARFLEASRTTTPNGTPYQNLCIGCDRFHEAGAGAGAGRGAGTQAGRPRRRRAAPERRTGARGRLMRAARRAVAGDGVSCWPCLRMRRTCAGRTSWRRHAARP